jgi:hypothetical protein
MIFNFLGKAKCWFRMLDLNLQYSYKSRRYFLFYSELAKKDYNMFDKQFTERIIEKCSADYKTIDMQYCTVVALNKL